MFNISYSCLNLSFTKNKKNENLVSINLVMDFRGSTKELMKFIRRCFHGNVRHRDGVFEFR